MTLVRIPKNRLRKGMYVELVECSQMDFDKRRFVLASDRDLEDIFASNADTVLINTALGEAVRGQGAASAPRPNSRSGMKALAERQEVASRIHQSAAGLKNALSGFMTDGEADYRVFAPMAKDLTDAMRETLAIALELTRMKTKDEGTFVHSLAVGAMMARVGEAMGVDAHGVEMLGLAGVLHDFGKLLIPNSILKKQGALTPQERGVIHSHPQLGYHKLKTYRGMPEMILDVCLHHHELLDGSGYPDKLRDQGISPEVRISTVCDVFDALTSVRSYKKAWTTEQALSWLFENEARFDRKVVVKLAEITDAYALSA